MTQGGAVLELEADCSGYISSMTNLSDLGFTFGNWDNRSEADLDFEWATGDCPQPVSPCSSSQSTISNFAILGADIFLQDKDGDDDDNDDNDDGDNDDDNDDGDDNDCDGDDCDDETDFGPAEWGQFSGWTDFLGEWTFYVKGMDGSYLETFDRGLEMGTNNRAFVMWYDEDSIDVAYTEVYIGGTLSVDIDLYD